MIGEVLFLSIFVTDRFIYTYLDFSIQKFKILFSTYWFENIYDKKPWFLY